MSREFYSHGKLLISGEYVVLDGYWGLGLPTSQGQRLSVRERPTPPGAVRELSWTSRNPDGTIWFSARFDRSDWGILESSDSAIAERLSGLLAHCTELNPDFPGAPELSIVAESLLEFPREWGLGSSSTLVHNLSQWAEVDPFRLQWRAFGGSGYDIACAGSSSPLLYRKIGDLPEVVQADFSPEYSDQLHFVYLNQKQDSREGIRRYREGGSQDPVLAQRISEISLALSRRPDYPTLDQLVREHEQLMSRILGGWPPVGERLFRDFKGATKSLGAWGGDFILALGDPDYVKAYFRNQGYPVVLSFSELAAR